jgi:prephenate dehydrogenase
LSERGSDAQPLPGTALVVGLGMMGASLAGALRKQGWIVQGSDIDQEVVARARSLGYVDQADDGVGQVDLAIVATPVSLVAALVESLETRATVVTDIASVKSPVAAAISSDRFVGGHPMTGSERTGIDGANSERFEGCTWVLTPTANTSVESYAYVRRVLESLGASVVTMEPHVHDRVVAVVSHVPHLLASLLMNVAEERSQVYSELLGLAAGGFRDMTRIAAGNPELWTDISLSNAQAIASELSELESRIGILRRSLENADASVLAQCLNSAAVAREELPLRVGRPSRLAILYIEIPDTPGVLGNLLSVFAEKQVNVEDLSMTHDPIVQRGQLHVTVDARRCEYAAGALKNQGYTVMVEHL